MDEGRERWGGGSSANGILSMYLSNIRKSKTWFPILPSSGIDIDSFKINDFSYFLYVTTKIIVYMCIYIRAHAEDLK